MHTLTAQITSLLEQVEVDLTEYTMSAGGRAAKAALAMEDALRRDPDLCTTEMLRIHRLLRDRSQPAVSRSGDALREVEVLLGRSDAERYRGPLPA